MNLPHLLFLKEKNTTWFNPSYGVVGFWEEYRKVATSHVGKDHDYIWKHRDLKRAKEIYALSIIALAIAKQDGNTWWIIKPKEDPPDGIMGTILQNNGVSIMHLREVEIVEHIEGEILDTIRKKLSTKQYEPNTVLVCHITKGGTYDLEKEASIISKEVTSLEHIFLVFTGQKISDIPIKAKDEDLLRSLIKVSLVQLKPVYSISSIDPIDDCKNFREGKEGAFFIYQGMGKDFMTPVTLENPPKLF